MIKWISCTMNSYRLSFLLSTLNHFDLALRCWHSAFRCDDMRITAVWMSLLFLYTSTSCEASLYDRSWSGVLEFLFRQKLLQMKLRNICMKANHMGGKNTAQIVVEPRQNPEACNWHVKSKTANQNVLINPNYSHIYPFGFWVDKWLHLFG